MQTVDAGRRRGLKHCEEIEKHENGFNVCTAATVWYSNFWGDEVGRTGKSASNGIQMVPNGLNSDNGFI